MTFRVGQKVVCIGSNENPKLSDAADKAHRKPDINQIYTIRSMFAWKHLVLVRLYEVDNRHLMPIMGVSVEPGYDSRGFRPLVERKTDISIFTRMLNPSKVEANA